MTNPSLPSLRCINTKLTQIGELFYSYSSPLLSYPPIYIYVFFYTIETGFLMCLCLIGVPEHLSHKRPLKWASFHIRDTIQTSTLGSVYPQSQPSLPCKGHKTSPRGFQVLSVSYTLTNNIAVKCKHTAKCLYLAMYEIDNSE